MAEVAQPGNCKVWDGMGGWVAFMGHIARRVNEYRGVSLGIQGTMGIFLGYSRVV